jgi:hypothetical protein
MPAISPVDSTGFEVDTASVTAVAVGVPEIDVEKVDEGLGAISIGKYWPGLNANVAFLA